MLNFLKNLFNRKIVSDPKLQYGIAGFFVILGLINFAFFVAILKIFESKLYAEANSLNHEASKYLTAILDEVSILIFNITTVFGLFTLGFSFLGGLLLLQHISGPIYAVNKFLNELLQGKKPRYPIILRKYDFFNELSQTANKVYERFELQQDETANQNKKS